MSDIAQVKLRSHHDERVASGHPWVFSNEIADDVSKLVPGAMVDVMDAKGKFLGRGYANPRSLIAIRILSRRRKEDLDHVVFYEDRLRRALSLREAVYPGRQSMRVVFGESDGLPGLVVDRYGDVLSVQITTLGMRSASTCSPRRCRTCSPRWASCCATRPRSASWKASSSSAPCGSARCRRSCTSTSSA
jgi:23S rRNA G2069 N7-methylase RlmK/C1962 C5-methylase RlmI